VKIMGIESTNILPEIANYSDKEQIVQRYKKYKRSEKSVKKVIIKKNR